MGGTILPAITGNQLIKLLKRDGWEEKRRNDHVVVLRKPLVGRTGITIVQPINGSLATGTLSAILSTRQTGLGKDGLKDLIERHGIR